MPYIHEDERGPIFESVCDLTSEISTCGQFAYALSLLMDNFAGKQADFTSLSQAIGIYESVKLEFYRRRVAPYEDEACRRNGEVFE
jgi:hypothetical protein